MGAVFRKTSLGTDAGLDERVEALMSFDELYTTGGFLVSALDTPLRIGNRIESIQTETHPTFAFDYERAAVHQGQLVIYQSGGGSVVEIPNGTDLSAVSVNVVVRGR